MGAARYDIEIPAAGTVEFTIDVVGGPADLTGYAGSMMIRELRADILPLATVPPSGITVNNTTRQVTVRIPDTETANYTWERGVYDLYINGSGGAWRIAEGRVIVSQPVTRS